MAKIKSKKPSLSDYSEIFDNDIYKAAGKLVGGEKIARELAYVYFDNMVKFDGDSLKEYSPEEWYHTYFIFLMGCATGEKNSEAMRAFATLSDAKPPIRMH